LAFRIAYELLGYEGQADRPYWLGISNLVASVQGRLQELTHVDENTKRLIESKSGEVTRFKKMTEKQVYDAYIRWRIAKGSPKQNDLGRMIAQGSSSDSQEKRQFTCALVDGLIGAGPEGDRSTQNITASTAKAALGPGFSVEGDNEAIAAALSYAPSQDRSCNVGS
jgi:hypothetical protein